MTEYYKVKDHQHLRRDAKSQAILNTNVKEAKEYELRSKMLNVTRSTSDELNIMKEKLSKIDELESDMKEIKELLKRIVSK